MYRSPLCTNETLFQSTVRNCDAYANTANLQTLENRLRMAHQCQQYLSQRAEFNDNMATALMNSSNRSIADVAQRYGRRTQMMVSMPAVYQSFHLACRKYDEAQRATANDQSSAQVATLVEQGLVNANRAIDTTQSVLRNAGEAPIKL